MQKVANKAFIIPTAMGQYFNEIYNRTMEESQNSKAKLVTNITKQLEANYGHQLKVLEQQNHNERRCKYKPRESKDALFQKEITLLRKQTANLSLQYQTRLSENKSCMMKN